MNVYIWQDEQWQPGANTLVYYPLETDTKDYSGNNRDLTNSGITFVSGGPGHVASLSSGNNAYYQNNSLFNKSSPFTYSVYFNPSYIPNGSYDSTYYNNAIMISIQNGTDMGTHDKDLGVGLGSKLLGYNYSGSAKYAQGGTISTGNWYHAVFTYDGANMKLYVNGVLVGTTACTSSYTGYTNARLTIGKSSTLSGMEGFQGKLSKVIVENKAWTATDVANYYNDTKSLYGIS